MNEVVTYSYDTWGKLLGIGGSMAGTAGTINPFRYRGYYYDTETGLYYLQSRYYDPSLGRFINEDGAISSGTGLLGYNMFAYCNNNPVIMSDADGTRPIVGADPISETPTELAESLAAAKAAILVTNKSNGLSLYKEHTSNQSPSNRNKHEDGQTRKQRDNHGEKGDARRKPNSNKRRPNVITPQINLKPVAGGGLIVVSAIAIVAIVADDATGVGVADDEAIMPLAELIWDGAAMVAK